MIYFDNLKEAHAQKETIEKWGRSLIFSCSDADYQEFLEGKRIWENNSLVLNPNYEAEAAEKERERLDKLSMTKADFWIALLDKNITKEMVLEKIETIEDEKMRSIAKIQLEDANNFYRGNPFIESIGKQFGFEDKELDYLFLNKKFEEI